MNLFLLKEKDITLQKNKVVDEKLTSLIIIKKYIIITRFDCDNNKFDL